MKLFSGPCVELFWLRDSSNFSTHVHIVDWTTTVIYAKIRENLLHPSREFIHQELTYGDIANIFRGLQNET